MYFPELNKNEKLSSHLKVSAARSSCSGKIFPFYISDADFIFKSVASIAEKMLRRPRELDGRLFYKIESKSISFSPAIEDFFQEMSFKILSRKGKISGKCLFRVVLCEFITSHIFYRLTI